MSRTTLLPIGVAAVIVGGLGLLLWAMPRPAIQYPPAPAPKAVTPAPAPPPVHPMWQQHLTGAKLDHEKAVIRYGGRAVLGCQTYAAWGASAAVGA